MSILFFKKSGSQHRHETRVQGANRRTTEAYELAIVCAHQGSETLKFGLPHDLMAQFPACVRPVAEYTYAFRAARPGGGKYTPPPAARIT